MKRLSIFFAALMACTLSFAVNYEQVTDASTLKAGDVLVIGSAEKGKVAAAIGTGKFLTAVDATFTKGVVALDNAYEITLGGDASAWTLTSAEGILGSTAAKTMAIGKGTTTWTIAIDKSGKATITCGTNGKILYNVGSPRFLNYTSDPTTSMILPELYKKAAGGETPVTPVAVESVALDQTELSLEAGKTATLVATITPANATNKEVTWKSDAETIATVADGVVTAVAEGTANITVTTTDGAKTATCAVTVTAAVVNPEPVVTFDATKDKAGNPVTTLTKDGITLTISNGTLGNGQNYRIYKSATLKITSIVGKINSVEFTCTAEGKAQYGPGCFAGTGYEAGTGYTGTWTGNAEEITLKASSNQVRATKIVVNYTPLAPDAIAKPIFTTEESDFMGSITVTLGVDADVDIYYTLDGTEPTTASTKYTEPFILTATTTVKAIAYNATTKKASEVAEKTYTKHEPMTCVEVNAAAQDAFVAFKKVTVVYVNDAYNYVKDETGYSLIYSRNYVLKAGQVVEGLQGTMTIFSKLPEVVPTVTLADLTITEGTAPEPESLTTVPTMADINKYVRIENVAVAKAFEFTNADKQSTDDRTLVAKLGEEDITLYNTFKINQAFEVANYNIIGIVTCHDATMQISVISAEKVPVTYFVDVNYDKTMGAVTGAGKYEENATATLTATANEGYEFVNWTVGEETKTDNPLTITVTADMTITANFQKESEVTVTELFTYTTNQDWDGKTFESAKFRDVAVHNGIAYVLKNSEARIVALDAKTGLYIKDLDVTGVSGGAIALSAIQVLKDGTLLAINCQSNCKTGDVKVYKWANKDAAPEVLFAGKLDEALRIDAFYYEGTLENGAIWTSYSGGEKGTTCKAIKIPVVNGVAGEFVSYALNNYALETSSRVISANDTEISIATKGKMYTWTINADKTTTIKYYTEIGNKRYSNNVKLFEFDGTKYMATVYWGDKTGTIMNPQIIVYSYTALGRWSTTGLTELFTAPTDLGSGRNISFFNGLDVVVGTKGFYVYMTSIAGGMTACYYGEPETPTDIEDTAIETIAPKAVKVLRNGQVYIIRDGKTYNMMGQIVE